MLRLTHTDVVLGKRTKWSERYTSYRERHFVKFDNEMRRFRKSSMLLTEKESVSHKTRAILNKYEQISKSAPTSRKRTSETT